MKLTDLKLSTLDAILTREAIEAQIADLQNKLPDAKAKEADLRNQLSTWVEPLDTVPEATESAAN